LQDRVRFCVDRAALDQNNAGQLADAAHVLFDYRLTDTRLLCGEAEKAGWIAADYEPHPGVAEIADSIEQDEGCSHEQYHRVRPHMIFSILKGADILAACFLSDVLHLGVASTLGHSFFWHGDLVMMIEKAPFEKTHPNAPESLFAKPSAHPVRVSKFRFDALRPKAQGSAQKPSITAMIGLAAVRRRF
jgi:hypothetical protein